MSIGSRRSALIVLAALLFAPIQAEAAFRGVPPANPVQARLVPEVLSVQPGKPFLIALELEMKPDWHVYWKHPGASGLPTRLDWQLPPGFRSGPLLWPIPQRFESQGLVTFGYTDKVILLTEITPPVRLVAGASLVLKARAEWLACRVECTPGVASLELTLPVAAGIPQPDTAWKDSFEAARASIPGSLPGSSFRVSVEAGQLDLHAEGIALPEDAKAAFYPEDSGMLALPTAQGLSRGAAGFDLRLQRVVGASLPDRLRGVLVIDVRGQTSPHGVLVDAPVTPVSTGGFPGVIGFLLALLFAFAGGVILNLMPCVLPVISLKVLSLVRQSQEEGRRAPVHGMLFAGGVLVSFWFMAAILAGARAAGRLLGWGFQLQSAVVVVAAAALFFLIALNLLGVFQLGTSLTRLGGVLRGRTGAAGSFLSGLFAAIVATPCTAPFMGAALGYALSRPLPVVFGVFTALGVGMAAPYLILAAAPRLASRLPKPGPWMETLRQVMGFPMLAAVIWMLFVLSGLAGGTAVIALLAGLLAAGIGAWAWGRWGGIDRSRRTRLIAGAAALVLAVGGPIGAAAYSRGLQPASPEDALVQAPGPAGAAWEPWSQDRVDQLRRDGTPVFIDFTARWCLSCQVNERVAFSNDTVTKRFATLGVHLLRADWTAGSDLIAAGLSAFGRASVPLYVYYPPHAVEPVLLPELLTPGIVLNALDRQAVATD